MSSRDYDDDFPLRALKNKLPSVRDYFIGQALAGILANKATHATPRYAHVERVVELAISVADAAMRRKKDKED